MDSYSRFALHYDLLTSNVDYEKVGAFVDEIAKKNGFENGVLLDLGCGTGSLSEILSKKGYDVIGVDLSSEMLSIAMDKKFESKQNILYVNQDMTMLELYGTVDITVSMLDCLNHLENIQAIEKTFQRVSHYSEKGSIFIFDINTIYKHKQILSENAFVFESDDVYCVWQNEYQGDGRVLISLDFFENDNELYRRYSESFYETAYELADIEDKLKSSGFEVVSICDFDDFGEVSAASQKVLFVARKV